MSAEFLPKTRAVEGEYIQATPAKINLSTAESIRQEMARVYRDARARRLDAADATKLVFILGHILKAHELGVIEARLNVLELNQQLKGS